MSPLRLLTFILLLLLVAPRRAGATDFRVERGRALLEVDSAEAAVVHTAAGLLQRDWQAVFGTPLAVRQPRGGAKGDLPRIVAATVGTGSALRGCGVSLKGLKTHREAFLLAVNRRGDLVVAGSDAHGTAYGLMELSRLIGVSPWEWWADCTPRALEQFRLSAAYRRLEWPAVDYRGVFINDEDWGFMPWASQCHEPAGQKGRVGPRTTERVFELLLRLRANTYWPPMHECTYPFFLTDGNREVARRFGIYLGSSHCEPMASSAAAEWALRGQGDYNYVTNREGVLRFWETRLSEVAAQEMVYTLGMRGLHDGAMQGARTVTEQRDVLTRVIADQRALLARLVNPRVEHVPQVFIPYKEVLDVYRTGLAVPDDVTLMWCDDNYGYLRHLPTAAELRRAGGHGLYYHASYWGRPHDYLWLGTQSPALLFHQLSRAYRHGIRKIWILNVGDIKPLEYQTELFMDLAWHPDSVAAQGLSRHLEQFLQREFGPEAARPLTPLMQEYYRLCYIRKPEFLGHTRTEERDPAFRRVSDLPWSEGTIRQRLAAFRRLSQQAETIGAALPADRQDAYFQLVGYPVEACALMNEKMLTAQLARHGRASFDEADQAYLRIQELTDRYNQGLHNQCKWRHMMDCAPRRLPVFAPVERRAATDSLPAEPALLLLRSAVERHEGPVQPCPGLGYYGGAGELTLGAPVTFSFANSAAVTTTTSSSSSSVTSITSSVVSHSAVTDTVEVRIGVVPTHPLTDDGHLRLSVRLDGGAATELSFETHGRSEEWKENVLRNLALRTLRLPLARRDSLHTLTLTALDEGLVLDHVAIVR